MVYKVKPLKTYIVNLAAAIVNQPDVRVRATSLREAIEKVAKQFKVDAAELFGVPATGEDAKRQ